MSRGFFQRCALLLLQTVLVGLLWSQQARVERLTTREGLSQGYVSCLLQDREGFIWAGTKNGLNRYDGYRFEVFTKDPYDEFSLANNFVTCLSEYGDFMLIGMEWGGVNILYKKTRMIYRLHCEIPVLGCLLENCNVNWAAADAAGGIWVAVQCPGQTSPLWRMYRFSIPSEFWKNPPPNNDWQKKITAQTWPQDVNVSPCMTSDRVAIYVPSEQGVFEIDLASGNWRPTEPLLPPEQRSSHTIIRCDQPGRYWMVRNYTVHHQTLAQVYSGQPDPPGKQAVQWKPAALYHAGFRLQHISQDFVWADSDGQISGYRLNEQGECDFNRPEITGITVPQGFCCSITDRSGILWIGTNGLGILKINLRSNHFRHLFPGESVYSPILQDRNGQIFAYSNTSKLLHQGTLAPGSLIRELQELENGTMVQDRQGACWMAGMIRGTHRWVLKKIDPAGGVRVFPIPYTDFNQITLTLDEQKDLWLGLLGSIVHFNPKTEQFSVFDFQKILPHNVTAMVQTTGGVWWLGTRHGLVRAKSSGGTVENFEFERLKNEPASRNSLREDEVASLLKDPNDPDILWIGTKGGGLDRLDTRTLQFTHLTTREGLPDNVIYGVLAESGSPASATTLWLSSNKGLIRYVPSTREISNYTEENGVQANEFNTWAYGKGPEGEMLFGGVNGMTVFHPGQLQKDTLAPRTFITRLLLNERDVSWSDSTGILTRGIEFTQAIEVPYSRNSLTLEFVALHFASTDKNRFRYYLEGAEKEWSHESAEHSAAYLNLAPGSYVFRVKSSNSEGVWSEQPAELKITVLPPWYRSWLAWLAYALILGGSAYAFYRYQLNTRLERAENQRLKELDGFKSRFFTNITHEFRTPLTVILGMAEQLKKGSEKSGDPSVAPGVVADLIRRSGQNLLKLINQMLDLAKLEAGHLRLNPERGDVVPFLQYLTESFQSYADTKDIRLHFHSNLSTLEMNCDKEKLQTVVTNLLSNALKFTAPGGEVQLTIRVGEETGAPGEWLMIEIFDTGPGIAPEKLPHIFDRFYQADATAVRRHEGTGIGLALVRELVKMMQGDIRVESEVGRGTVFTVALPTLSEGEPIPRDMAAGKTSVGLPAGSFPSEVEASEPASFPAETGPPEAPLVLIVEDNPDVRYYLTTCLQADYRIVLAENGQEGVETAFERTPDLVVSDVMMPEKDGFDLCETLKNDPRTSHIPVVLLTAKADISSRIEGLTRGADDYLAKPFDRQELLVRLRNLLDSRQRLRARYASMETPVATQDPDLQIEDAFLQNLRNFLESRLDDAALSLETICRAAGMGRTNLNRKLTALTGKSAMQYLRSLRLHRAQQLLSEGRLNISEIAFEVGYDDPKYFSRVFTEEFGVPPTQWQKGA